MLQLSFYAEYTDDVGLIVYHVQLTLAKTSRRFGLVSINISFLFYDQMSTTIFAMEIVSSTTGICGYSVSHEIKKTGSAILKHLVLY